MQSRVWDSFLVCDEDDGAERARCECVTSSALTLRPGAAASLAREVRMTWEACGVPFARPGDEAVPHTTRSST